jgi:hypothetical protein
LAYAASLFTLTNLGKLKWQANSTQRTFILMTLLLKKNSKRRKIKKEKLFARINELQLISKRRNIL